MGNVFVDITMSLDGFVTAPNDRAGHGPGDGGEYLHNWVMGGAADGSFEQVAEDLAELRSLGADQVFWSMVGTEPDAQLHALELLLAQEER